MIVEHVPRYATPAMPPTNEQRIANWREVYRYFANEPKQGKPQ